MPVQEDLKISNLLRITNGINENHSASQLIEDYQQIVSSIEGIQKLAFYNHFDEWKCLFEYKVDCPDSFHVSDNLFEYKEITKIDQIENSFLSNFNYIIPVFHKDKPLSYLLVDCDIIRFNINDLTFIQALTNILSVAIENKRFAKQIVNQEIEKRDLQVASDIQKMLFPSDLPSDEFVDIDARFVPKQLVGGDYYDFVKMSDHEFMFCMADVSGKGVSAALLMANFQAVVRAHAKYTHQQMSFTDFLRLLNNNVMETAKGEKFITFFIGYYNKKTKILKYINAGHNYPILYDGKNVRYLDKGTVGLGMIPSLHILEEEKIEITSDTIVVCYTDGLVESENSKGQQFEIERIVEIIKNNKNNSMKELNDKIFQELEEFTEGISYPDDTALMSVRIF